MFYGVEGMVAVGVDDVKVFGGVGGECQDVRSDQKNRSLPTIRSVKPKFTPIAHLIHFISV